MCGNCSNGFAFVNNGKKPCKCGRKAPLWVQRGLTHNENLLEIARATEGNDPSYLEKVVKRARAAAEKAKAAAAAKAASAGSDGSGAGDRGQGAVEAKLRARVAELEAEAKLREKDGGAGGDEPCEEAATEQEDFKSYQSQARAAEVEYKARCELLEMGIKLCFKGIDDPLGVDVHAHPTTGPLHRDCIQAEVEMGRLRALVRTSRPLDAQVANKTRSIEELEGKVAANQDKEKAQAAVVEELEGKLREAQEEAAEIVGTVRGQLARLHVWREELTSLRLQQLGAEGGGAPPAPVPVPVVEVGVSSEDLRGTVVLRAQCEGDFMRGILGDLIADPAGAAVVRKLLEVQDVERTTAARDAAEKESKQRAAAAQENSAGIAGQAPMDLSGGAPDEPPPAGLPGGAAAGSAGEGLPRGPIPAAGFTAEQAAAALAGAAAMRVRSGSRTPRGRSPGGRAHAKDSKNGGKET